MHTNWNSQHGSQGDEIGSDVAIRKRTVIGTPVGHDRIHITEGSLPSEPGYEPGGRPGGTGPLIQDVMGFIRQFNGMPFSDLQDRSQSLYNINPASNCIQSKLRKTTSSLLPLTLIGDTHPFTHSTPSVNPDTSFRLALGEPHSVIFTSSPETDIVISLAIHSHCPGQQQKQ